MNLNLLVDQNNPFSSYNLSESLIIKYPNKKRWGRYTHQKSKSVISKNTSDIFLNKYISDINETYHVYSPNPYSQYRQFLNKISKDICNNKTKFQKVFKEGPLCKLYEYYINDIIANIKLLKVFVQIDENSENISAQSLIDDYANQFFINHVFKKKKDILEVVSLILYIPKDMEICVSDINGIVAHEMKHILDTAWNTNTIKKNLKNNDIIIELIDKYEVDMFNDSLKLGTPTSYKWSDKELILFFENCIYYSDKSENSAFLETAISEIKNNNHTKITENNINAICYEYSIDAYRPIYTLNYYLDNFINYYNKNLKLPFNEKQYSLIQEIISILNQTYKVSILPANQYSIIKYFKKWNKIFKKFLSNIENYFLKSL